MTSQRELKINSIKKMSEKILIILKDYVNSLPKATWVLRKILHICVSIDYKCEIKTVFAVWDFQYSSV